MRPVGVVARRQAVLDIVQGRGMARQVRFLRQVAHGGPRLHEDLAPVGLDQSTRDLQQGRLAGPVAPDQAQAVAAHDGKLRPFQQGRAAEGQVDVAKMEDGRCQGMGRS